MKRTLLLILIFVFASNLSTMAQYDPHYKYNQRQEKHNERRAEIYSGKIATYTKMKKIGTGLGLAGGVLSLSGALLVSSADWETTTGYNGTPTKTTSDPKGATGLLMLVAGVPLAVTGIVLGSIGSYKVKSYREKLSRISLNIDCTRHKKGLVLTYRF